jgi:choline kinase
MRVVIPAAGRGTRLYPLTQSTSKALVQVCGRPLLSYTLEWLADLPVEEAVVVLGHQADDLRSNLLSMRRRPPLRFVDNRRFASTNSVVSLALTVPFWRESVCVMDSDVLASPELLRRLTRDGPSALVVDTTRSFAASDMKVELRNGAVWHMDKAIDSNRHHGEFFGLSRWSGEGLVLLAEALRDYVDADRTDTWYEFPIRDVAKRTPLTVVEAREDDWAEIDRAEDIPRAERLVGRLIGP